MAISELRGMLIRDKKIDPGLFDASRKKFSNALYFKLQIGLNNGNDILQYGVHGVQAYSMRINDITFNAGKHVYLLTGKKDTVRAEIADLQRSYGMSPNVSVLFAFPKAKLSEHISKEVSFIYRDVYFGIPQPVTFKYNITSFSKVLPGINLNNNE